MSNRSDKRAMSAAYDATDLVTRLERAELHDGVKLPAARASVARRIGVSPGTLQSNRRGRVKRVAHEVFQRLHAALERQLEREIEAATHELLVLRAAGARMDTSALVKADENLARARQHLAEARQ